ncbi:Transcription factor 25 [Leucoagaricus sp. SymC.cos]|nr:Transcription factor 25 [Leucoagaricus sp. SymC.cos]
MPPRLNKRQQRELEELETLGGAVKPTGSESSDDETLGGSNKGVFAAAAVPEDDDDDSDVTGPAKKSKKSKKKKKKPAGPKAPETEPTPPPQSTAKSDLESEPKESLTASERKALKKAKQKEKKAKVDDLDQALAELAIRLPPLQEQSRTTAKIHSFADLLGVSLQHLDAEAELRKFFGSRVVQATKTGSSSPSRRNAGALRSNLTRPQSTWWSASQREGLSIQPLSEDEILEKLERNRWDRAYDEKWWTVEYSKKYKSMTKAFMRTVLSGDPQGFYELLRKLPWHADTLLQLSEVYRHREEHAQAVDFIDRALFTYERSFIGAFNFTSGINRLDFDRVENRPFFLALHRQVVDLQRRGCIRTAFEFARLLYSLDPWTDPHGATLHLDQLAIKANMAQWLVDVYDVCNTSQDTQGTGRLNPSLLPGWAYSYALALHILEKNSNDHTSSTTALTRAICDYPSIIPLLADKLEVSLPISVRGHPQCKIETDARTMSSIDGMVHLLSHLYAHRSSPIWKDHTSWFVETVTTTFAALPTPTTNLTPTPRRKSWQDLYIRSEDLRYAVYRHVIVLESNLRRLLPYLPNEILNRKSIACDPLPPKNAVTLYDDEFFEGVEDVFAYRPRTRREIELDRRRFAQMVPDAEHRQQIEAIFEANDMGQMFPGGIVQFVQEMAQIQHEDPEDIMMFNEIFAPGGGGVDPGVVGIGVGGAGAGVMPGQMPGEDILAGLADEDVENDVGPAAQRGGLQDVDLMDEDDQGEEDEEDEDEEEDDEIAVSLSATLS